MKERMVRKVAEKRGWGVRNDFRWRGGEVSRIEGFSDAVFAFSVTLLVVSLEVPKTFNELMNAMQGFIAFTFTFALLIWVWYNHYLFFRRYGLQDTYTIILNAVLLFVVLFYIYPLKFLATLIVDSLMGKNIAVHLPDGRMVAMIEQGQSATLMIVYGAGFLLVFLCFALLYVHAYRKRGHLELNPGEMYDTISELQSYFIYVGIGFSAVVVAVFIGNQSPFLSSVPYWCIGPIMTIHGKSRGNNKKKLLSDVSAERSGDQTQKNNSKTKG